MSLPAFLSDLFDHGRLKVPPPAAALPSADLQAAGKLLAEQAAICRQEFPGVPPAWSEPAALWAAVSFYQACQLVVYRDLDAGAIDELLAAPCPPADPSARHWSVDLTFRFLPDLLKHAAQASGDDPLVLRLRQWAAEWPLSSVGAPSNVGEIPAQTAPSSVAVDEIAAHSGLLQLYVDRILAKKDWSRLGNPLVKERVKQSIGAYRELWPELVKVLPAD